MTPDEVSRLAPHEIVLVRESQAPINAVKHGVEVPLVRQEVRRRVKTPTLMAASIVLGIGALVSSYLWLAKPTPAPPPTAALPWQPPVEPTIPAYEARRPTWAEWSQRRQQPGWALWRHERHPGWGALYTGALAMENLGVVQLTTTAAACQDLLVVSLRQIDERLARGTTARGVREQRIEGGYRTHHPTMGTRAQEVIYVCAPYVPDEPPLREAWLEETPRCACRPDVRGWQSRRGAASSWPLGLSPRWRVHQWWR
jgi:hypothetical protein